MAMSQNAKNFRKEINRSIEEKRLNSFDGKTRTEYAYEHDGRDVIVPNSNEELKEELEI